MLAQLVEQGTFNSLAGGSIPPQPTNFDAGLAQLGERRPYKADVAGSSPATCTTWFNTRIAQLVEQWIENPRVTGSIPVLSTTI